MRASPFQEWSIRWSPSSTALRAQPPTRRLPPTAGIAALSWSRDPSPSSRRPPTKRLHVRPSPTAPSRPGRAPGQVTASRPAGSATWWPRTAGPAFPATRHAAWISRTRPAGPRHPYHPRRPDVHPRPALAPPSRYRRPRTRGSPSTWAPAGTAPGPPWKPPRSPRPAAPSHSTPTPAEADRSRSTAPLAGPDRSRSTSPAPPPCPARRGLSHGRRTRSHPRHQRLARPGLPRRRPAKPRPVPTVHPCPGGRPPPPCPRPLLRDHQTGMPPPPAELRAIRLPSTSTSAPARRWQPMWERRLHRQTRPPGQPRARRATGPGPVRSTTRRSAAPGAAGDGECASRAQAVARSGPQPPGRRQPRARVVDIRGRSRGARRGSPILRRHHRVGGSRVPALRPRPARGWVRRAPLIPTRAHPQPAAPSIRPPRPGRSLRRRGPTSAWGWAPSCSSSCSSSAVGSGTSPMVPVRPGPTR